MLEKIVDSIISQGKVSFERVMLDNRAARSTASPLAYLKYCAFCGIIPKLRPRNRIFKDMGQSTKPSLGFADIHLPTRSSIALTFDIDLVDQDVPILIQDSEPHVMLVLFSIPFYIVLIVF